MSPHEHDLPRSPLGPSGLVGSAQDHDHGKHDDVLHQAWIAHVSQPQQPLDATLTRAQDHHDGEPVVHWTKPD